jgi:hypothetical protein
MNISSSSFGYNTCDGFRIAERTPEAYLTRSAEVQKEGPLECAQSFTSEQLAELDKIWNGPRGETLS